VRVVVLGGYGYFGSVIAKALAAMPGISTVVAGRDAARASCMARTLGIQSAALDADSASLPDCISALRADWVVSTAGPFQGADYRVARAAAAAGACYVDIADGRDFVCGIPVLDGEARSRRVLLVSGASSVPALSSAVIDHLADEFASLQSIDIGIASSSRLPGPATVSAVLGYCGRAFPVWRDGAWRSARGWQRLRRHHFHGANFHRWIADCDVPDLTLLPPRYPGVLDVTFGAGAGSALGQAALFAASCWGRMAPLPGALRDILYRMGRLAEPFGPRRSAMFVRLAGTKEGGVGHEVSWELVAEDHHGRHIPCMGAVALIRKAQAGRLPVTSGAMACVGLLSLDEYLAELQDFPIRLHVRRGCEVA
jgi:hypothetical protein